MIKLPSWCANPEHSHEPHINNGECYGPSKPVSTPLQTEESYKKQLGDAVEEQAVLETIAEQTAKAIASARKPLLPSTAKELLAVYATMSDIELIWAVRRLPEYEKYLLVECAVCGAGEGEECRGRGSNRRVHGARYVEHLEKISTNPVGWMLLKMTEKKK